jgi:hypothetical protein
VWSLLTHKMYSVIPKTDAIASLDIV